MLKVSKSFYGTYIARDGISILMLSFAGMSKITYIEAVLNGVDSAISECLHTLFVR